MREWEGEMGKEGEVIGDLGHGSKVMYTDRFISRGRASELLCYLDANIPWTRPSLLVFGRSCSQPRETCYIAKDGLPLYKYSGYEPPVCSWDDYPPLRDLLNAVHDKLPGTSFNSLLLNRYKSGCDYVGWHSDNESLYGPTPTIASVTLGAEREFLLRKKKPKSINCKRVNDIVSETGNPLKRTSGKMKIGTEKEYVDPIKDKHSFILKHGSLFVMTGFTQRDWEHSLPRRKKVPGLRINLTFRYIHSTKSLQ